MFLSLPPSPRGLCLFTIRDLRDEIGPSEKITSVKCKNALSARQSSNRNICELRGLIHQINDLVAHSRMSSGILDLEGLVLKLLPASRAQVIDFHGPAGLFRGSVLLVGGLGVEGFSSIVALKDCRKS